MLQSSHSFFYSILFKIFLSSHLLLLNHLSLFLSCFSYSLFLSFFCYYCLVLFNSFSHWSLQTFLFHSFEISFCCDIRSLFLFPFTYSAFSICQSCYFVVFLFHSFKTCSHSHREIRTNMHDKGIKWNANPNEPSLCYRPLIAAPGRTLYVQTVTLYSAQPDFDIEISHCSCSAMRGHNSSS